MRLWNFEEGSGTTITDQTAGDVSTFSGPSWTASEDPPPTLAELSAQVRSLELTSLPGIAVIDFSDSVGANETKTQTFSFELAEAAELLLLIDAKYTTGVSDWANWWTIEFDGIPISLISADSYGRDRWTRELISAAAGSHTITTSHTWSIVRGDIPDGSLDFEGRVVLVEVKDPIEITEGNQP